MVKKDSNYEETKAALGEISPTFCAAKWLQTTLHLQNGNTHSCHHPDSHCVPIRELKKDPSALHNSIYKKRLRKMMLEGAPPKECFYCWEIEKASKNNYSDRVIKSNSKWAKPYIKKISETKWHQSISPTYLEVSFGHECNMACCYCRADISSRILAEVQKHGDYPVPCYPSLEWLRQKKKLPIPTGDPNPYIDAFWEWFPDIINKLHNFRVTGGEPLINENTYRLLDYLVQNKHPKLTFSLNSNFCVSEQNMQRFYEKLHGLVPNQNIKDVILFGSIDGHGKNAEYTRFGLDYKKLLERLQYLVDNFPHIKLYIMCTYNVFSIINFNHFLKDIYNLRKTFFEKNSHMENPIGLDISHLRYPDYLSITTMRKEYGKYIKSSIEYMKKYEATPAQPYGFTFDEINKISRIYKWFMDYNETQDPDFFFRRYNFYLYFQEYDKRKNISLAEWCPEYVDHFQSCRNSYIYFDNNAINHFAEIRRRALLSKIEP